MPNPYAPFVPYMAVISVVSLGILISLFVVYILKSERSTFDKYIKTFGAISFSNLLLVYASTIGGSPSPLMKSGIPVMIGILVVSIYVAVEIMNDWWVRK